MIVSFRDKTIAQLKSESHIEPEESENQQIENLNKELEFLKYKIENNPELESLKAKNSKLQSEIENLKGSSSING